MQPDVQPAAQLPRLGSQLAGRGWMHQIHSVPFSNITHVIFEKGTLCILIVSPTMYEFW